nr:uncharacterized protein LOC125424165 [Ziziphus jujuba var. spinosa]
MCLWPSVSLFTTHTSQRQSLPSATAPPPATEPSLPPSSRPAVVCCRLAYTFGSSTISSGGCSRNIPSNLDLAFRICSLLLRNARRTWTKSVNYQMKYWNQLYLCCQ